MDDAPPSPPRFVGLVPASARASRAARGAIRKTGTRPELLLRRALWRAGCRYRVDVRALPGRPDLVFPGAKVAVFVDGDFWHGRDLEQRLARLQKGHNPAYWTQKVATNVARDRRVDAELAAQGWHVLRLWETDVARDVDRAIATVRDALERARR